MRTPLLLCLLVVLSGCSGAGVGGAPTTPGDDSATTDAPTDSSSGELASTPSPTSTRSESASTTPTPTPTATPAPPSNPWRASPVTVELVAAENSTRDYRPLVERTLRFWENESTGYELAYRITDDGNADVTVRFVADITVCDGRDERTVGCADFVPRGRLAPDPTVVRVETGYTDAATLRILKHEFGHTLGYDHDDTDSYQLMEARGTHTRLPEPNATSLDNPWRDDSLLVSVVYPDVVSTQRTEYEAAVERALTFYRTDERSTLPPGASLETTANRSAADIVIDVSGGGSFRSIGNRYGVSTDTDDALERFERYEVTLHDVDRDRLAWHVGYWLGWAFGAESRADLPAPFDDPEEDDREEW